VDVGCEVGYTGCDAGVELRKVRDVEGEIEREYRREREGQGEGEGLTEARTAR
jgi:hypothetical protein